MFKNLKQNIKQRDGICQICGSNERLTIDHIIPIVEGGTDDPANLQALCKACNLRKAAIPPLRQRIYNLFNGNIYFFKREVRDVSNGIRSSFNQFKDNLEGKLKIKFSELDSKLLKQQDVVKVLEGQLMGENKKSIVMAVKVDGLEKEVTALKDRNILLKEAIFKVEALAAERIVALQNYHKLEWQPETKSYIKIKRRKQMELTPKQNLVYERGVILFKERGEEKKTAILQKVKTTLDIDLQEYTDQMIFDLLNDVVYDPLDSNLYTKFLMPPFSTLDTRNGVWQERRKLLDEYLGDSTVGRADGLAYGNMQVRATDNGTSRFDSVLCEVLLKWFTPNINICKKCGKENCQKRLG